jgi:hypothetical protein
MDSSRLFLWHHHHRVALHHLFGVELATRALGDIVATSDGREVLVRDIAVAHCREDLCGKIPGFEDWLADQTGLQRISIPMTGDDLLQAFIEEPYLRTGLDCSSFPTCSDFGVYLALRVLGHEKAMLLRKCIPHHATLHDQLRGFQLIAKWQYTPDRAELTWLRNMNQPHCDGPPLQAGDL